MPSSRFVGSFVAATLGILLLYSFPSHSAVRSPLQSTCSPVPTGLVSWWSGEGNANDLVGANHGTLPNGASFSLGKVGQAFSFNGYGDSLPGENVSVEDSADLNSPSISIEGWFLLKQRPLGKRMGGFDEFILMSKYSGNYQGWVLRVGDDLVPIFSILRGPTNYNHVISSVPLELNTWSHIAISYDGTTARIYVNGVKTGSLPFAGGYAPYNGAMKIGTASWYTGGYMNGLADEISIYNRAISDLEIQAIYNSDTVGKCGGAQPTPTPTPTPTSTPTPTPRPTPTPTLTPTPSPTGFSLQFPLQVPRQNVNPYTAMMSSVLDHSGTAFYRPLNSISLAYTGELGDKSIGPSNDSCVKDKLYKNAGGVNFVAAGNYVSINQCGSNKKSYQSYDGHSGYDYSYGNNTVIAAPADGVLKIPKQDWINGNSSYVKVVNGKRVPIAFNSPWCGWHTFYIDHGNGYSTWFLHADRFHESIGNPIPANYCDSKPTEDIVVKEVKKGEKIAYSGNFAEGRIGGVSAHLHFEVRYSKDPRAPLSGKVIDPYGWEGITADPIIENRKAVFNENNLWGVKAPVISRVSPSISTVGSFDLTVTGSDFDNKAEVEIWYESDLDGKHADGHFVGKGKIISRVGNKLVVSLNLGIPGKYLVKARNGSGPRSKPVRLVINEL